MRHALLAGFLLLTACGQAGDLYLPGDKAAKPAAPPAAQPDTPQPDDNKKKDAH
jgi:predicted small lipoprotein YifL